MNPFAVDSSSESTIASALANLAANARKADSAGTSTASTALSDAWEAVKSHFVYPETEKTDSSVTSTSEKVVSNQIETALE